MTRINCVPPKELNDRMLVSEYHELPRVFQLVKRAIRRGEDAETCRKNFPRYTLGQGHVRFFFGRLKYLAERKILIIEEMLARKMRPNYSTFSEEIEGIPKEWFGEWVPTGEAIALNRQQLKERLTKENDKEQRPKRKVITPYNEHELKDDFNGKE